MRVFYFTLIGAVVLLVVAMARLAGYLSGVAEKFIGGLAGRLAGFWFVTGTGWGGDDVVLDAVDKDTRLQLYITDEARRQQARGARDTHVQFLYRVALASDEHNRP